MQYCKQCLLPVLVICLIVLNACNKYNSKKNNSPVTEKIENLLSDADSLSGISLIGSEEKANEALELSQKSDNSQHIVESLILIGKIQTLQGKNDSALIPFNKALALANQKGYQNGICRSKIEIGDVYYTWGNYDKALTIFSEAKSIAESNQLDDCEALVLNYMGKYYHIKNDFAKTFEFYQRSLVLSRNHNNYKQIAIVLSNLGKYYISVGKLNLALDSYLEAFRTCEKFNDKIIYAEVCNHLGGLYLLIDQPEKSLEFHHKALNNRNVINNPEGIAKSYNNIGKIFLDRKQSDSALVYFSQSLELCQKTGYNKGTVKALTNLGKVYLIQNKPEKQKEVLQRAFNISKESGYTIGMAESGMELGNYYRKLQKSDLAIRQYQLSLKMTGESNQSEILQADYYGLYQCYLKKGAVQEALENHILLSDIEKKLLNVENNRQIAILQISYETHRKEKYNQVLLKDLELGEMTIKRKTDLILLIIIALGSCFLLCVLLYLRIVNRQKANRILGKLNLKIVKQNTELEILNAELEKANQEKDIVFSIITHELRNPLYWFQNLVEMLSKKYQTMKPDKVQKTLLALDESAKNAYHLMDNLLNWSRTKLKRITPNKEKHSLLSLVNETIRMYETILEHKEILLQVNIFGEAMIYVDRDLFTCVLRNLISNAIKYTPSNGIIEIGCVENELKFLINVSDSGKGIDERNMEKIFDVNEYFSSPGLLQEKGSGLGLKICIEFVELNNGKIWATSEPGKGTTFNFTVPKVTMGIEPGFE